MIAGLALVTLRRVQVFASGDHAERSYGYQVSLVDLKQSKLKFTSTTAVIQPSSYDFSYNLQEVLTIDAKRDFCHPHAHCGNHNNPLPVPNGDSAKLI